MTGGTSNSQGFPSPPPPSDNVESLERVYTARQASARWRYFYVSSEPCSSRANSILAPRLSTTPLTGFQMNRCYLPVISIILLLHSPNAITVRTTQVLWYCATHVTLHPFPSSSIPNFIRTLCRRGSWHHQCSGPPCGRAPQVDLWPRTPLPPRSWWPIGATQHLFITMPSAHKATVSIITINHRAAGQARVA